MIEEGVLHDVEENSAGDIMILTGHCFCGAITFQASGQPVKVAHCHCGSCRRAVGAAMVTSAGFRSEQILFTNKQPTQFTTDDAVSRGFCDQCGSSVSYKRAANDYVFIYIGLFDEPDKLVPQVHMMYSEKIEWMKIDDALPKSDEFA